MDTASQSLTQPLITFRAEESENTDEEMLVWNKNGVKEDSSLCGMRNLLRERSWIQSETRSPPPKELAPIFEFAETPPLFPVLYKFTPRLAEKGIDWVLVI